MRSLQGNLLGLLTIADGSPTISNYLSDLFTMTYRSPKGQLTEWAAAMATRFTDLA
jgi:hypothetical protein